MNTNNLSIDFMKVMTERLSQYHKIFQYIQQLGKIHYNTEIKTACVKKHKNEIIFIINPNFFNTLTTEEKIFIIAHEALHILFNHLNKITPQHNIHNLNIAMDVVINEMLINQFDFKQLPTIQNQICTINNIFSQEQQETLNITQSTGYQEIYNIINQLNIPTQHLNTIDQHQTTQNNQNDKNQNNDVNQDENNQFDNNSSNDNQSDANHDENNQFDNNSSDGNQNDANHDENNQNDNNSSNNNQSDAKQDENNQFDNNSSNDNQNDVKQDENNQFNDNLSDVNQSDVGEMGEGMLLSDYEEIDEGFIEDILNELERLVEMDLSDLEECMLSGDMDGVGMSRIWSFRKKNVKWKRLLNYVSPSVLSEVDLVKKSFARYHLPLNHLLSEQGLSLPFMHKKKDWGKKRVILYFFFDISGSCVRYQDEFLDIVKGIPQNDVDLHLFTFDTQVKPIFLSADKSSFSCGEIKAGGGTNFLPLQEQIHRDLQSNIIHHYPDMVCVLTDGIAHPVNNIPEKEQKKWIWVITSKNNKEFEKYFQYIQRHKIIPFHDTQFNPNQPKINSTIKQGCKIMPSHILK